MKHGMVLVPNKVVKRQLTENEQRMERIKRAIEKNQSTKQRADALMFEEVQQALVATMAAAGSEPVAEPDQAAVAVNE